MARPVAKELTERELEIMHLFWHPQCLTAAEARDQLAQKGRDLSYPTVANLIRGLEEKGFLTPQNLERPFQYQASKSYQEVSGRLLDDILAKVFRGSRQHLLSCLFDQNSLSVEERTFLESILENEITPVVNPSVPLEI